MSTVDFILCAVLLTTFYRLLLAVWSRMNTVLCQLQSLASLILFFFAEVSELMLCIFAIIQYYYSVILHLALSPPSSPRCCLFAQQTVLPHHALFS